MEPSSCFLTRYRSISARDRIAYGVFLLAVAAIGFVPEAYGIVRRDDKPETDYLLLAEQFPSVGQLSNNGSIRGSGVLIHQEWVLTAAHVSGNELTFDGTLYTIAEFIRHPDWDGNASNGDDIALVRLNTAVSGVTPSSWFTGTDQTGVDGISVGFGRTGTGLTGEIAGTHGIKRAGQNTIEGVGAPLGGPPFGFQRPESVFEYEFNAPGDPGVLPLEGMAATYDSGGGFFAEVDGSWEVAGIHSYVLRPEGETLGQYGQVVGSTRVSLYDEWVVSTIPEPSTWALFIGTAGLGVALLGRRRRFARTGE